MNVSVLSNSYLKEIGIMATSYGVLCCLECQLALPPEQMFNHIQFSAKHNHLETKVDEAEYAIAIVQCDILPDLPAPPSCCPSPLIGLCIEQGLVCAACNWKGRNIDTFNWHYSKEHKGIRNPKIHRSCTMQRFNPSEPWFEVQTSQQPTPTPTPSI